MRIVVVTVAGLVLVLALVPEFHRYSGEHSLYRATALFESMLKRPASENRDAVFEMAATSATDAAENLSGDSRPLLVAGSLRLFAHEPAEAVALYRKALAFGERAEIDLNLGRAYEMLGDHAAATAAILRAAWISPAIISALPDNLQAPLQNAIAQDEDLLRQRHLPAPPPLPADTSQ